MILPSRITVQESFSALPCQPWVIIWVGLLGFQKLFLTLSTSSITNSCPTSGLFLRRKIDSALEDNVRYSNLAFSVYVSDTFTVCTNGRWFCGRIRWSRAPPPGWNRARWDRSRMVSHCRRRKSSDSNSTRETPVEQGTLQSKRTHRFRLILQDEIKFKMKSCEFTWNSRWYFSFKFENNYSTINWRINFSLQSNCEFENNFLIKIWY